MASPRITCSISVGRNRELLIAPSWSWVGDKHTTVPPLRASRFVIYISVLPRQTALDSLSHQQAACYTGDAQASTSPTNNIVGVSSDLFRPRSSTGSTRTGKLYAAQQLTANSTKLQRQSVGASTLRHPWGQPASRDAPQLRKPPMVRSATSVTARPTARRFWSASCGAQLPAVSVAMPIIPPANLPNTARS